MKLIFKDRFIGVRAPLLKQLAKNTLSMQEINVFLHDLPHFYFDENMLHSVLLSNIKDYQSCIEKVQEFLPYIDNWAVCDTIKPKVFKKNNKCRSCNVNARYFSTIRSIGTMEAI